LWFGAWYSGKGWLCPRIGHGWWMILTNNFERCRPFAGKQFLYVDF
jgi:hypothetical protein